MNVAEHDAIEERSYEQLDQLANSCPESVALFTDAELVKYAQPSIQEICDDTIGAYVLGEMLVRLWLYKTKPEKIREILGASAIKRGLGPLVDVFESPALNRLRETIWSDQSDETLNETFADLSLNSAQERILSFAKSRTRAFLECDGVIPVIFGEDAVAVPFRIIYDRSDGKIIDANDQPIASWSSQSKEVWKALDCALGIRLQAAFGNLTAFPELVSGGSFALAVLFAATRDRSNPHERHPLAIVCTGELGNGRLKEIEGRKCKQELAIRLGASRFFAPGVGSAWPVQAGMDSRAALQTICRELREDSGARLARFDRIGLPFSADIRALVSGFRGRRDQLGQVLDWVERKMRYSSAPARLWISGRAGCGKSAFMAALCQECMKNEGWRTIRYFFGRTHKKKELDFLESAALQTASLFGEDKNEVTFQGDGWSQFRSVLDKTTAERKTRLIFVVDGVNQVESKDTLRLLANAAIAAPDCIWIFAGQVTPKTSAIRDLPDLEFFPNEHGLGGLRVESISNWVNEAAPDMPNALREALISRAGGLPLYTKYMLDKWERKKRETQKMTVADVSETISDDFREYYQSFVEDISTGPIHERSWRTPIPDMLALLATAREGIPLTTRTLQYVLSPRHPASQESDILTALEACIPVLRFIESTKVNGDQENLTRWTVTHDSFRAFFNDESSPMREYTKWAKERWKEICTQWSRDIEPGAMHYALRYVFDDLEDAKNTDTIVALARDPEFIELQKSNLGAGFAEGIIARAIEIALAEKRLPEAAALLLTRAEWMCQVYAQSPLAALQQGNNAWALELVSRLENQNDRTVWHLAIAAWHMVHDRPQLAAQILDEHVPASALRERLPVGASMCAAACLCILFGLKTQRFRPRWFLSQLSDSSKKAAARSLIRCGQTTAAWSMLGSIFDSDVRDEARLDVIRELSAFDAELAERQLFRFENEITKAWGAQICVGAYAKLRRWREMDRVLRKIDPKMARQRAKALCYVAIARHQAGDMPSSDRAFNELDEVINRCWPLDAQAMAWAEFASAHAELGYLNQTEEGVKKAFRLLAKAEEQSKARTRPIKFGARLGHLQKAHRYVTLVMSLSRISEPNPQFLSALKTAVSIVGDALQESGAAARKINYQRLRLIRALATRGHFDLAFKALARVRGENHRTEAAAFLCVYMIRRGAAIPNWLKKQASGKDGRMFMAGLTALELYVTTPPDQTVLEICKGLPYPRVNTLPQFWGRARILSRVAASIARSSREQAASLFDAAKLTLNRVPDKFRAWYLIDLGHQAATCGQRELASNFLEEARSLKPETEEEEIQVLARIEQLEAQFELRPTAGIGAFTKVISLLDDNPLHKMTLMRRLLLGLAESGRRIELDEICTYANEHLVNDHYGLLPEERAELAGNFAADLARSAFALPAVQDWSVKFQQICENLARDKESEEPVPDSAIRAHALLIGMTDLDQGIETSQKIRTGEQHSKACRDLALIAVSRGRWRDVIKLCRSFEHDRSEHLADIADELARRDCGAHPEAQELFEHLVVLCSDYPDAAYRAVAALISFYTPTVDVISAIVATTTADQFAAASLTS